MLEGIPRFLFLAAALAPFLLFAGRDNMMHFQLRKVSPAEHILHAGLGLALAAVISMAFQARFDAMITWLALFCLAGCIDEYGFHRDIPAEEHDVHAKEHFALLFFVAMALVLPLLGGSSG